MSPNQAPCTSVKTRSTRPTASSTPSTRPPAEFRMDASQSVLSRARSKVRRNMLDFCSSYQAEREQEDSDWQRKVIELSSRIATHSSGATLSGVSQSLLSQFKKQSAYPHQPAVPLKIVVQFPNRRHIIASP